MIKVLIVDDSQILRNGLETIIEQYDDIKVIGTAQNGIEALEHCKKAIPDLILIDIRMPICDGIEGTRIIKEFNNKIKIIILTTFDDNDNISKTLNSGADGYILKDIQDDDLINTIRCTVKGLNIIQNSVFYSIKNQYKSIQNKSLCNVHLSEREKSIIKLIVDGRDNREISLELHIAEGTVRNTISNILEKLELRDRTQLAVFAIKNDIA
jgi:DNA-binding NarL/FixJ family response regulator